jgi:hypothetical protein
MIIGTILILISIGVLIFCNKKLDDRRNESLQFALQFISCIVIVCSLFFMLCTFFIYCNKQVDLNKIELEYNTLCVKFMTNKGSSIVEKNLDRLIDLKTDNDSFLFDATVPDRVDELYSKYEKMSDYSTLEDFKTKCPVR